MGHLSDACVYALFSKKTYSARGGLPVESHRDIPGSLRAQRGGYFLLTPEPSFAHLSPLAAGNNKQEGT